MQPLTLELLESWRPTLPTYGVLGFPVAHSLSPAMHQAAYQQLKIQADYLPFAIRPEELPQALDLLQKAGVLGVNLTVPHKQLAVTLVDILSDEARLAGSVNTIRFADGKRYGYTTDGRGFSRAIREQFCLDIKDLRVLLLGTGGAGRAIAMQLAREKCERLVLVNRDASKADALLKELAPLYHTGRLLGSHERLRALALSDTQSLHHELDAVDLIINATSLGLQPSDASPLPAELIQPHHLVYDTIYNPPQTALLRAAAETGARTANGLSMLLHQGCIAFEIWLGVTAPVEAMRAGLSRPSTQKE